MARRYKRDRNGRFAGGGGGGSSRGSAPKTGKARVAGFVKQRAVSAGLRAAAQGVTVTKTVGPVQVQANISVRPAPRAGSPDKVSGGRIPRKRRARRGRG